MRVRALELPAAYPKDPTDRIIGATALIEGMPLLTADREIRRSRALHTIGEKVAKVSQGVIHRLPDFAALIGTPFRPK